MRISLYSTISASRVATLTLVLLALECHAVNLKEQRQQDDYINNSEEGIVMGQTQSLLDKHSGSLLDSILPNFSAQGHSSHIDDGNDDDKGGDDAKMLNEMINHAQQHVA
jgi:hypothetical protein